MHTHTGEEKHDKLHLPRQVAESDGCTNLRKLFRYNRQQRPRLQSSYSLIRRYFATLGFQTQSLTLKILENTQRRSGIGRRRAVIRRCADLFGYDLHDLHTASRGQVGNIRIPDRYMITNKQYNFSEKSSVTGRYF